MNIRQFIAVAAVVSLLLSCNRDGSKKEAASPEELHNLEQGSKIDSLAHEHEEHQADHKIYSVTKRPFNVVYKASGTILADTRDEVIITAKSPGIVRFEDQFLYPGVKIKKGTPIFSVSGENLTENNTTLNFARIEADYQEARENMNRAESLIGDKLITAEHYLDIKNEYSKIEAEYKAYLESGNLEGNSIVRFPDDGFIVNIDISEGQVVAPGDRLATIIIENKMILKADVSPPDMEIIPEIEAARFSPAYSEKIYSTSELNGSRISYGRSTGDNSFYIPVYFMFDYNRDLIPGTYVEVWLLGRQVHDALVIPNSGIMEEYGKYFVFVEEEDEVFEKRYITLGHSNGSETEIISGIHEGENIVSEGAYQVKMGMATTIPSAHNHNH